jgi:hypothetical protein
MLDLRDIGFIVETVGRSETRVPNFFLGLPTGAFGPAFGTFGTFGPADFFFGAICFFAYIHKRKKNALISVF